MTERVTVPDGIQRVERNAGSSYTEDCEDHSRAVGEEPTESPAKVGRNFFEFRELKVKVEPCYAPLIAFFRYRGFFIFQKKKIVKSSRKEHFASLTTRRQTQKA